MDKFDPNHWEDIGNPKRRRAAHRAYDAQQAKYAYWNANPSAAPAWWNGTGEPVTEAVTPVTEPVTAPEARFDWETATPQEFEDPAVAQYLDQLKRGGVSDEAAQASVKGIFSGGTGYEISYWHDPAHVARYYNAIKATPPGTTLPEWMTPEMQGYITETYKYMEFRNNGAPWTEWKWLNPNDKALQMLAALPPPPPAFLWPGEEKFAAQTGDGGAGGATIENVMAGEAAWGDVAEEERKAILNAPDFDIELYDPMVRQQMLSDPNFNWGALPAWQQTLFKLQSNPLIGGAVQGFMMGGMSWKGAVIGMVIGKSAEVVGYNPNKWFYEQGNGDDKMQLSEVGKVGMGLLNDLGQLMEVTFGYAGQVLDPWVGGRPDVAMSLLTDPVQREAALRAARVAYEASPFATFATNAVIGISNLFTKEDQAYVKLGEQIILGKADPVELMPGVAPKLVWYKAMGEARQEIAAAIESGGDPQAVMDGILRKWWGYAGAPVADLFMQATADPLNVLPGISEKVEAKLLGGALGKVGESIGRPEFGKALETAANPTEVVKTLQAVVRTLPAEKVGELPALTRWMAGVNEKGEVTAGLMGLYPSETLTSTRMDPKEKVGLFGMGAKSADSWFRHILTLTPEARARTGISMAMDNMGTILAGLEPEQMESFFNALNNSDLAAMKEVAGNVAGAAEFYTVLPMLKGWGKLGELAGMWEVSAENRGLLLRIADILAREPGRVVEDLGKRDGAARVYETLGQLMTKSKDAGAKALLAEMKAGRFTVADLEAIGKTFTGPDALPWHPGAYKAMIMESLGEHAATWARDYFGLKADSGAIRLAHVLKSAQSMLLLGLNPNYAINNIINNEATRMVTGNFGFLTKGQMNDWMTRLGVTPSRIREGVGATGEVAGAGRGERVITEAMRGEGWLAKADNVIRATSDKVGLMANLAKAAEGMESAQAYTISMKKGWGKLWERGRGFREMDAGLTRMLREINSGLPELVYRAIEGGMNEKEIMARLQGRETGVRARDLVTGAAQKMGMTTSQALTLLEQAGVMDQLDAYLKRADTPDKRDYAFRQVEKRSQAWIDMKQGLDIRNQAEHVATAIKAEGSNRVWETILYNSGIRSDRWLDHYMKADEVASAVEAIGDEFQGQKSLLWLEWFRSDGQEYARTNATVLANLKGMIEGFGLDAPEAQKVLALLSEEFKMWDEAYKFRLDAHRGHFDKWQGQFTLDTIEARMADWDAISERVDAKFQEAFKNEPLKETQIRDLLTEQMRRLYGDQVADAALKAYQQTIDFRAEMVAKLQEHRKGMKNLFGADRRAANRKFYQDTYTPRVVESRRIFEGGVGKVQDVINGKPGADTAGTPTRPPEPMGPVAPVKMGSPWTVETGVGKVDFGTEIRADTQVRPDNTPAAPTPAAHPSTAPGTAPLRTADAVWKIASENGMSGVDANGNMMFGAKLDVIKFVKKWGGGEGGRIVRFDDITSELMQKAVDSRNAWEAAQLALPKIDASNVEGLKSESANLPEPTKGATEASEKALAKAEADLTPSPFPVGKGREAKSPYDLVHDRAVNDHIMDMNSVARDALQYELSVMRSLVESGEPGMRIHLGYGIDKEVKGISSSYPDWYGPLKGKKENVLIALTALEHGMDKPEQALYRNLKGIAAALLNDDAAISERWDWAKAWGLEDEVLWRVDKKLSAVTARVLEGAAEGNYEALHRGYSELADVLGEIPKEVMGEKVRVLDMENGQRVPTAETYTEYTSRLWDEMSALYDSGTAEHLNATAELAMKDAQAKGEMVMTRELLREQLTENVPDATPEQIDMALDLADARAESWARASGRTAAEWYGEHVAPMVRGAGDVDLMQGGRIEPVNRRMIPVELNDYAHALVRAGADELRRAIQNEPNRVDRVAILDAAHDIDPKMAEAVAGQSMDMLYQTAYHGSPHKFDKFTLDHMGEGEGAQAYGWGLYFAGNKSVAEWYRRKLSTGNMAVIKDMPSHPGKFSVVSDKGIVSVHDTYKQAQKALSEVTGQLYKVELPDENYLLWDKPLSEQPQAVKDALKKIEGDYIEPELFWQGNGKGIYQHMATELGSQLEASLALKEIGLNGIQYLDATSRGKGEGSYNYVIFDDAAVQVKETFYQDTKGGVTFLADGRAVIHAFEGADVSTIVHEIGHIFRRDLSTNDLKIAEDWAGVVDGKWTRESEEKFARGFEEYLADGSAPTAKLKAVFQKFKEWMVGIYRVIAGSAIDVNLTPEMRGVFDRLLAEDGSWRMENGGDDGARIAEMGREAGVELYPKMKEMAEGVTVGARVYAIGDMVRPSTADGVPSSAQGSAGWTQATVTEVRADGSLALDNGKVVSSAAVSLVGRPLTTPGTAPLRTVESAMLFQSADPRMPLGGIDQASGYMPEGAMLDEAWSGQIRPLLEAMREEATRPSTARVLSAQDGGLGGLPPETQAALNSYVKQVVRQDMPGTKLATVRYGEGMRDFAMLNYSKKYGFDKYILDPIVPYQFWTTRTGMNWLTRVADKPALFANMLRLNRFASRMNHPYPV